jgi:hypothetical protein
MSAPGKSCVQDGSGAWGDSSYEGAESASSASSAYAFLIHSAIQSPTSRVP